MKSVEYLILLLFIFFQLCKKTQQIEYYASPNGINSNCSFETPCLISSFWNIVKPGDTLFLNAGIYKGPDSMIIPPYGIQMYDNNFKDLGLYYWNVCSEVFGGTKDNYITIKGINGQGQVIIDGIRFQNSRDGVITLSLSSHNIFKNISAYNANYHLSPDKTVCPTAKYYNHHVFAINTNSNYNLVEDVILGGSGRNLLIFSHCRFGIARRVICIGGGYTRDLTIPGCPENKPGGNHGEPLQLYGSSDIVIENCLFIGINSWEGHIAHSNAGVNIWCNTNETCYRNKFLGTLVRDYYFYGFYHISACHGTYDSDECLKDAFYENCVAYKNGFNFYSGNGQNITVRNTMLLMAGRNPINANEYGLFAYERYDADQSSNYTYENLLSAYNGIGCATSAAFTNITIDHALFTGSNVTDLGACTAHNLINVFTNITIELTSLVYIDEQSPIYTMGKYNAKKKKNESLGADLRCRYFSKFENGEITTIHSDISLFPLPDYLNERTIQRNINYSWEKF